LEKRSGVDSAFEILAANVESGLKVLINIDFQYWSILKPLHIENLLRKSETIWQHNTISNTWTALSLTNLRSFIVTLP